MYGKNLQLIMENVQQNIDRYQAPAASDGISMPYMHSCMSDDMLCIEGIGIGAA
jgi:hypothetical protein